MQRPLPSMQRPKLPYFWLLLLRYRVHVTYDNIWAYRDPLRIFILRSRELWTSKHVGMRWNEFLYFKRSFAILPLPFRGEGAKWQSFVRKLASMSSSLYLESQWTLDLLWGQAGRLRCQSSRIQLRGYTVTAFPIFGLLITDDYRGFWPKKPSIIQPPKSSQVPETGLVGACPAITGTESEWTMIVFWSFVDSSRLKAKALTERGKPGCHIPQPLWLLWGELDPLLQAMEHSEKGILRAAWKGLIWGWIIYKMHFNSMNRLVSCLMFPKKTKLFTQEDLTR